MNYYIPQWEERTSYGFRRIDPYAKLFEDRIIFLGTPISDDVANAVMQRSGDGGRRRVDGVDLVAGLRSVEPVRTRFLPALGPRGLQPFEDGLLRNSHRTEV